MSSGGKTASSAPMVAGITQTQVASNQKAVPVPYHTGPRWHPFKWLIKQPLNPDNTPITAKIGKKDSTTGYNYFGDLVALLTVGLSDEITGLELANEEVWLGSIVRPDDPDHPDYWRAHIVPKGGGDWYYYWGRADQPLDDIVLGPLGALDPSQAHSAYRHQAYLVGKRIPFGQSNTAPSGRARTRRSPTPTIGTFPKLDQAQGESLVAADLELLTSKIFGAGADPSLIPAAKWEALSTDVVNNIGCHGVYLDRERSVKEIIRDHFGLFDGWARIEDGQIVPGRFPHDGTVPAGLTEISHHDIIGDPNISAPTPSKTINKVSVKFSDRDQKYVDDYATATSRTGVRKRTRVQPVTVDANAIIDRTMAQAFAAEKSRTNDDGESSGDFDVRRPRAKWSDGRQLQAGDNFNLDWYPYRLDQVSRISKISWPYRGNAVAINYVAERGLFPLPYVEPSELAPSLGSTLPTAIINARVLELSTQLAGTPLGIDIAYLVKRPASEHENNAAVKAKDVLGFNLYLSGAGASYSLVGTQTNWAVRGVLRADLGAGDGTALVTLDADNLDIGRLIAANGDEQANDRLLLVIGDEVLSIGAIGISGLNRDLNVLRGRQGTNAAAAATGAEVWLVYRSEITPFAHKLFVEDTTVHFKAQPFTSSNAIDLGDIDPLDYHFRDRADELPVVLIDTIPAAPRAGIGYFTSGRISDVNGDLTSFQVNAAKLVAPGGAIDSEITLQAGPIPPADRALFAFKAPVVFDGPGTWIIVARGYDERSGFTETRSAEFTVAAGDVAGFDDGLTPNTVTSVVLTPGLGMIVLEFDWPTNTPARRVRIYESTTSIRPANPSFTVSYPQAFFFRQNLSAATNYKFWLEVEATNGRMSTIVGPFNATTRAGVDLSDIAPNLTMVGVVSSLPASPGQYLYVLLTTDLKLYRWDASVPGWTRKVDGADLILDSVIAGALAAGAVTAYAVGANLIITNTANIGDAVITGAKIALAEIGTAHIQDLNVTTIKIAGNAVTVPVYAYSAGVVYSDTTYLQRVQSVTITTQGGPVFIDCSMLVGNADASLPNTYYVEIVREDGASFYVHAQIGTVSVNNLCAWGVVDVPPAGTYTYYLVSGEVGSGLWAYSQRMLRAVEFKK